MNLNRLIGISLHSARVRQGLTLREVAQRSTVSLAHLSDIERAVKEPSSTVLESILRGLNLSLEQLLRDCLWRVSEGITDPFGEVWFADEIIANFDNEMETV